MPPERLGTSYCQHCVPVVAIYWPDFPIINYLLPFDAFSEMNPLELSGIIWYGKTRMTGLQSGEGRMMIDSVIWAQYMNITDTQHCVPAAKIIVEPWLNYNSTMAFWVIAEVS